MRTVVIDEIRLSDLEPPAPLLHLYPKGELVANCGATRPVAKRNPWCGEVKPENCVVCLDLSPRR